MHWAADMHVVMIYLKIVISLFLAMIMFTDACKMTIAEIVNIRIFMYNCNLNAYLWRPMV